MDELYKNLVKVAPREQIHFKCNNCGTCCRNVKQQVPLETLDAFRIARYLQNHGEPIHCMDDILELYAEPALLDECGYFVYFLKTVGENDACIFLDENNRCKIHSVNPRACRTYPFIAAPLDEGGFETLISFERKFHFNGPVVHPRTWMKKRFTPEDKEFLRTDLGSAKEIARLFRKVPKERLTTALVCFQRLKYGDYELDMPFLPQYERNTQLLLEWLREEANVSCQ